MTYITTRQKTKEKQISWLDLISEEDLKVSDFVTTGSAGTITRVVDEVPAELLSKINIPEMIKLLEKFNESHSNLFEADRNTLYRHFFIPKRSGGLRPIDAPCDELQNALEELRIILTDKFGVLYHTAAFAYISKRCTTQMVRKHKENESNWFFKTDVSGFFPSTTLDFAMKMLSMVFPLSEICKVENGRKALRKALSLGFLNGGLPQGTKLSPCLTNLIAIPIDHRLFNELAHRRFVYTRYADDVHISCVQSFDKDKMTKYIQGVFKEFGAPWILKPEKTAYQSRKGSNWMLGVMLNGNNDMTVGWRNKKLFKAMTTNLIMDYKHNKPWSAEDVQQYAGLMSYYKMVEREYFDNLIEHFNSKFGVDLKSIMKNLMSYAI